MSVSLPVFTSDQLNVVQRLLALKVAHMMGRKLEEGDWAEIYCAAKEIPLAGWSNLNIDVMHGNLGVEHKMLCYRSKSDLSTACGSTLMHPSATRSFRINPAEEDPNAEMRSVLGQYADLIQQRRDRVARQNKTGQPVDLRVGWLLWQESLRQFLYFEEPMLPPDPDAYFAEWHERSGGARKGSRNLWIYEKASGKKRYSVTTSAGAKIQPYFDVPDREDDNLYLFTVIGEPVKEGIRAWITRRTANDLEALIGDLNLDTVSAAVSEVAPAIAASEDVSDRAQVEEVVPIALTDAAYTTLVNNVSARNDEHRFQLIVDYLNARTP
jgi:hypothetical protein